MEKTSIAEQIQIVKIKLSELIEVIIEEEKNKLLIAKKENDTSRFDSIAH